MQRTFTPGRIVLDWNAQGELKVQAPLDQKDDCQIMLGHAVVAIASQRDPVRLPALKDVLAKLEKRG